MDEILTTGGAAAVLEVSPSRVHQFAAEGQLPCVRMSFGYRVFRADDVAAFAEKRRQQGFSRPAIHGKGRGV